MGAGGQARVNKARWFVNYDRANKLLSGPYSSVREAQAAASLLAPFGWNRPVEDFSDSEISSVVQTVNRYREDLEFRSQMAKITGS
jgi:hypothetical protein